MAAAAVVVLVVLYLGVGAVIADVSLTPHRKLPEHTPADAGLVAEAVQIQSAVDHLPLAGWFLPSWGERAILLLHGLDSHSWEGSQPVLAQAYVEAGFHVLVFDLRGHGRSGGQRLGLGWHERRDVRAAVLFIHGRADAVIPVEHAYRLQAAAQNAAAELWLLPGLGHTKGVRKMREAFLKRVVTFFDRSL